MSFIQHIACPHGTQYYSGQQVDGGASTVSRVLQTPGMLPCTSRPGSVVTVTDWPAAATGDASASVEHSKLNELLGHGHLEYSIYTLDVHGSAVLVAHSRFTAASIAIIT